MPQPIIIVEYNPKWPVIYEKERTRILGALGHILVAIEHIGSTAVPDLGSRPIIDIMAAVHSMSHSLLCIEPLKELGYDYNFYTQYSERCVFLDGSVGAGPHHLHMTEFLSDFWLEKVLFRDYLRSHPEVAQQYYRLKLEWAVQFGADRDKYESYTEAKTEFIGSVLVRARAELQSHNHRWIRANKLMLALVNIPYTMIHFYDEGKQ